MRIDPCLLVKLCKPTYHTENAFISKQLALDLRDTRAALTRAKREIKVLSEQGTQRIRDFGHEVDDAEKTYGPILARIDATKGAP